LRGATNRTRLTTDGQSGAGLERATMADGRPVIVKYLSPSADWIMRATADTGREAELWRDGTWSDAGDGLENPVIAAERYHDGWVIAQHDVSSWLLPDARRLGSDEARRIIAAAHALHRRHQDQAPPAACTLAARAEMFSPRLALAERWSADLVPKLVGRGWDMFPIAAGGIVADDVVAAVLALVDDPSPLVAALERDGTTLIHGDLKHANLGLTPERVIAIDWGMACRAPVEVELAWYLECGVPWVAADEDELVVRWRELRDPAVDPWRWRLAMLFEVVISGWSWALFARDSPYPADRARCAAALAAWMARAREALDVWAP
jgi:hypothetical protein